MSNEQLRLSKCVYVAKDLNYPGDYWRPKNGFSVVGQRFFDNKAFIHRIQYNIVGSPNYQKVIADIAYNGLPEAEKQNWVSVYVASGLKSHGGSDIPCKTGSLVTAAIEGTVVEDFDDPNLGNGISIVTPSKYKLPLLHQDPSLNGTIVETHVVCRYWHSMQNTVSVNQFVKRYHVVAYANSTGKSTGPHVHFETKYAEANGNTLFKDNGWLGRFDHLPYIDDWDSENPYLVEAAKIPDPIERIPLLVRALQYLTEKIKFEFLFRNKN